MSPSDNDCVFATRLMLPTSLQRYLQCAREPGAGHIAELSLVQVAPLDGFEAVEVMLLPFCCRWQHALCLTCGPIGDVCFFASRQVSHGIQPATCSGDGDCVPRIDGTPEASSVCDGARSGGNGGAIGFRSRHTRMCGHPLGAANASLCLCVCLELQLCFPFDNRDPSCSAMPHLQLANSMPSIC